MESLLQLGARHRRIVELLLQGCPNTDIAEHLHISARSVRADLNRLFVRFGIRNGIKRVKLATLFRQHEASRRGNRKKAHLSNQREEKVVSLLAQGLKNHEIAEVMGTTEGVIKNYLGVIYDKLGLWNRVELALWYATPPSERPKTAAKIRKRSSGNSLKARGTAHSLSHHRNQNNPNLGFRGSAQLICFDVAEKTAG